MKKTQYVAMWFLPVIVIGGLFYPVLGYLVIAMMASLIILSFFKGRFWCWNLCPRGAFLDIVMPKLSLKRPAPRIFARQSFRWAVFALLMGFVIFRLIQTGGNLLAIGAVFVSMCLITTIVSVILAVFTKPRSWCTICPMGTLQNKIDSIMRKRVK